MRTSLPYKQCMDPRHEHVHVHDITNQCPPYGVTVHLFIGKGRNLDEITFMSLTFTVDHNPIRQAVEH
jgi:hypothetical protein